MFLRKRVEDDYFVHAVEKFRPEVMAHLFEHRALHSLISVSGECAAVFQNHVAADVGGHDHDGVLEVHHPALTIGKPAVVQYLKQHVEHVVVSFFDLIKQDHRVRPAAHGFRQLAAFLVANVSGRRPDQPRDRVLLLVFTHIDANHRVLIIKHEFSQRASELGFADAGRPEKDK